MTSKKLHKKKFKISRIWQMIRTISGDNAYDIYLKNYIQCKTHNQKKILSRRQFFIKRLEEKWSGVNRCC